MVDDMARSKEAAAKSRSERKREEQAAELRADIIDAAFAEFATQGFHATTMAHIADRLGVSAGTCYNHFKNKRDIVDHVIDRLMNELAAALQAKASTPPVDAQGYLDQAQRVSAAIDEIFAADPRIPRFLLLEATSIDDEMTKRVMEVFDAASRTAAVYLDEGIERGIVRSDIDVGATADVLLGMMLSVALRNVQGDRGSQGRLIHRSTVIDVLLNGVLARS